ncbi:hypothetical protein GLW05_08280 [Pontibacillus yanchengensis]|uniref:Cardiolipin synthase N-terminal domain-containing protein n=1 Tax=Pontibacillus yanchengensis TaxID=462910 RepID=A0A6I5A098_9BACI|nr:hypothetical protein [Pontibacillus yanchengensis]MYL33592.1 hypothetical protein [Pontibacillus yanchengensis]
MLSNIPIFTLIMILVVLAIPIYLAVWAYKDAKQKDKGAIYPVVVFLMVLCLPFVGIFLYAMFRNR